MDYAQNSKFIQDIGAQHVVLVHGEASQMGRLRAALRDTYASRGQEINIHTPKNCEPLTLTFRAERMVKVGPNCAVLNLGNWISCGGATGPRDRRQGAARIEGLLVYPSRPQGPARLHRAVDQYTDSKAQRAHQRRLVSGTMAPRGHVWRGRRGQGRGGEEDSDRESARDPAEADHERCHCCANVRHRARAMLAVQHKQRHDRRLGNGSVAGHRFESRYCQT